MIGKALPGNSNFPETSPQTIYSLSIGKIIHDPQKLWAVYLNYPSTGLSVYYSHYGNNEVFGHSITVLPYFSLNTSKRHFNSFHFKIGMGASYFSTSYNKNNNPRNLAVGSRITWVFQTTAYYNLLISKHVDLNLGVGAVYKQVVKLRLGITYRFYHQYYNYIIDYQPEEYKDNPIYSASNLQVYFGCELLLGHVGVDAEIGINILKPFYSYHQDLYGSDEGLKKWLKSTFSTRLGLKFYLNNTANNPKNNLYVGAYINANFGQADFSEISLGFVHRFGMRENK